MRYFLPISLLSLSCSATVNAQQSETRQWFNSIQYTTLENTGYDYDTMYLSSHYYFAPQQNSGVWDDYGYLDTDSNIKLDYSNNDLANSFAVFGEGFYGNWFANLEFSDLSETDDYSVGVGYLFADDLKVSVQMQEFENIDTIYRFTAQYNYQLNDSDYLGLTADTDDELEIWSLSTRYFAHLNADSYLAVDVAYHYNNFNPYITSLANYYFNRHVAVGAGVADSKLLLEAKYFIDSQYYFTANFFDRADGEVYSIKFVAQF